MPSALIHVMTQAAEKAAKSLVRDYGEVEHLQVSRKGPADFVSRADRNAERIIHDHLQYARPDWGFLMEEGGMEGNQEARFIIDPLDGTSNFLHAVPHFCISIAAEISGHLEAGVIFDPIKNEFYTAERGKGAFLNQRRLRVSSRADLIDAMLAIYLPTASRGSHNAETKRKILSQISELMAKCGSVRHTGSAALDLAYVASGRLEAFWDKHLSLWDVAAGVLMVKESGGYVNMNNDAKIEIMASNEYLHEPILQILRNFDKDE